MVDTIVGAIVKRLAAGHDDGVAVVAEGIAERLDSARCAAPGSDATPTGICISPTSRSACPARSRRAALKQLGIDATVISKDIGYELRCAQPVPFDVEYTRTLGYAAVRYLLGGGSGALIAITGGRVTPVVSRSSSIPLLAASASAPSMSAVSRTRSRAPT